MASILSRPQCVKELMLTRQQLDPQGRIQGNFNKNTNICYQKVF